MDVRVLGPLEVSLGDGPIARAHAAAGGAGDARAGADRTVSADRLVEGLWGERAPPSAAKIVQLYVSQLRELLDGEARDRDPRARL